MALAINITAIIYPYFFRGILRFILFRDLTKCIAHIHMPDLIIYHFRMKLILMLLFIL